MLSSTLKFKLVVGIECEQYGTDPEGFFSHDECAPIMEEFFHLLHLKYDVPFVSVSIRPVLPQPVGHFGGGVIHFDLANLYGHPFILKDEAIAKVDIVCAGDFLNTMCPAVAHHLRGGNILEYQEKIKLLTGMTEEQKKKEIWIAYENKVNQYAEARIYGVLSRDDCEDPDSALKLETFEPLSDDNLGGQDEIEF